MRAVGRLKETRIEIQRGIESAPPRRDVYAVQRQQVAYSEIQQYNVVPTPPIQNPDGSLIFIVGYSRPGFF